MPDNKRILVQIHVGNVCCRRFSYRYCFFAAVCVKKYGHRSITGKLHTRYTVCAGAAVAATGIGIGADDNSYHRS